MGSSRPPLPKFGLLTPTVVICDPAEGNPKASEPLPPRGGPASLVPARLPLVGAALGGICVASSYGRRTKEIAIKLSIA